MALASRRHRRLGLAPTLRLAGLVAVSLLAAGLSLGLIVRDRGGHRSFRGSTEPGSIQESLSSERTTEGRIEPEPAVRLGEGLSVASTGLTLDRAPAGPRSRAPSPLVRSPGYYPPDDPESLSVVTGRRDAPAVALELTGGAASLSDFAQLLIAALQAKDERAMHALRISRKEFDVILWPEFPESRPITRITSDDAWELSEPTSRTAAGRAIGLFGSRPLDVLRVTASRREAFRNFTLHRDVVIETRDTRDGSIVPIRVASTIVERHGRFKALIYKD